MLNLATNKDVFKHEFILFDINMVYKAYPYRKGFNVFFPLNN